MISTATRKLLPRASVSQQLFLDEKGYIVESDDRIFPAWLFKERAVTEWLPFFESIFHILQSLSLRDQELRFERVNPGMAPLTGYYDFSFLKVEMDNRIFIVWSVYDITALCLQEALRQQQINDGRLRET